MLRHRLRPHQYLLVFLIKATGALGNCPDYLSNSCVTNLKQLIDESKYSKALNEAEAQCYGEKVNTLDNINEEALTRQALGCYYSHLIERFFSNSLRSQSALERANQLIRFGCSYNMKLLCELTSEVINYQKISIRNEIAFDIEKIIRLVKTDSFYFKSYSDRILPKNTAGFFEKFLNNSFKKENIKMLDCGNCNKYSVEQPSLSIILQRRDNNLIVHLEIYDPKSKSKIFSKKYGNKQSEEIQDLYSQLSLKNLERKKTNILLNAHKKKYGVNLELGFATMENHDSSKSSDKDRIVASISSSESFNYGRDSLGLKVSFHKTVRGFYGEKVSDVQEATKIPTYRNATALSFIYYHSILKSNFYVNKPYFDIGLNSGYFFASETSYR